MARLHERTGTIVGLTREGRAIVEFDDPTRCCDASECEAIPVRQKEVRWGLGDDRVGTRVVTWWERRESGGGLVGEVLREDGLLGVTYAPKQDWQKFDCIACGDESFEVANCGTASVRFCGKPKHKQRAAEMVRQLAGFGTERYIVVEPAKRRDGPLDDEPDLDRPDEWGFV